MCTATGCDAATAWKKFANTLVYGGVKSTAAVAAGNISQCQNSCILYSNCTGLDWYPYLYDGSHCWLHGPWSRRRVDGSATGITHYDLNPVCHDSKFVF